MQNLINSVIAFYVHIDLCTYGKILQATRRLAESLGVELTKSEER